MPPADTAVKIACALGVSVEYLVTGEETVSEELSLPADLRPIVRNLLRLDKNDRKIVTTLVNGLLERQGTQPNTKY